jgi:NAD(P)-dependent dehydrogenase (short-subunit alcohol dehydrogenase family)
MSRSYVATGGAPGVGRAIVGRSLSDADDNSVVTMELDAAAFSWTENHPADLRVIPVLGDASDEAVAERAADLAEEAGALEGWVNNAADFRHAQVHSDGARDVLDAITLNLDLAVVACATAIGRFLSASR